VEEFESCGAGVDSGDDVGGVLRGVLVERYRYESYDFVEVVESHREEGFGGVML
jgi:hypothetical protein